MTKDEIQNELMRGQIMAAVEREAAKWVKIVEATEKRATAQFNDLLRVCDEWRKRAEGRS